MTDKGDDGGNWPAELDGDWAAEVDAGTADLLAALGIRVPERTCPGCGKDIDHRPADALYCDARCGDAYRHRVAYARKHPQGWT